MTSFDVVAALRRVTKIKQIGHTGTLDPFATGVLPVCIGKAAKLIEYLPDDKEYIAAVKFGFDTDTYDLDGKITKKYDCKISKVQLEEVLKIFEGEIEQYPPKYSAIKIDGKKLYEYARSGQDVEIKPRKVVISKIKLLEMDEKEQTAKIAVACSKGTYIRSIAYDIGQKLSCGAHLIALERTKAGVFNVENSVKLENMQSIEMVKSCLIDPSKVFLQNLYEINDDEKEKVIHGNSINLVEEFSISQDCNFLKNDVVFLIYSGKMIAVGIKDEKLIKVKKVFEVL